MDQTCCPTMSPTLAAGDDLLPTSCCVLPPLPSRLLLISNPPPPPTSHLCPQHCFSSPLVYDGFSSRPKSRPQNWPNFSGGCRGGSPRGPCSIPSPATSLPITPAPPRLLLGAGQGHWMAHHPAQGGDTAWSQGHQEAIVDSPGSLWGEGEVGLPHSDPHRLKPGL